MCRAYGVRISEYAAKFEENGVSLVGVAFQKEGVKEFIELDFFKGGKDDQYGLSIGVIICL